MPKLDPVYVITQNCLSALRQIHSWNKENLLLSKGRREGRGRGRERREDKREKGWEGKKREGGSVGDPRLYR